MLKWFYLEKKLIKKVKIKNKMKIEIYMLYVEFYFLFFVIPFYLIFDLSNII